MSEHEVTEIDFELHTFEIISKLSAEYYANLSEEEATQIYTLPEDERSLYVDSLCYDKLRRWAYRKNQEILATWSDMQKERRQQHMQDIIGGLK